MGNSIEITKGQWGIKQVFSEQKNYLKVPIAVLGEWFHPEYGQVKFDQTDFDSMLKNWDENVVGYEPPLFLGHPIDNTTIEGAPSVAFLEKLYQESDTLYGLYNPVDDKAYQEAARGAYRYSSAEVSRNAVSKKTGQSIGTVLRGAALTNRPFLTGMPRVEAVTQQFSESVENNLTILFPLTTEKEMTTQLDNNAAEAAKALETQYQALSEKVIALTLTVEDLSTKLVTTEQKLSEANSRLEKQDEETLLAKVALLNISAESKETFSEMIKTGGLSPEQREKFWNMYAAQSANNVQVFSEPKGLVDSEAVKPDAPAPNPYASVIAANNQILAERQGRQYV
jgi:hypothetical protein